MLKSWGRDSEEQDACHAPLLPPSQKRYKGSTFFWISTVIHRNKIGVFYSILYKKAK